MRALLVIIGVIAAFFLIGILRMLEGNANNLKNIPVVKTEGVTDSAKTIVNISQSSFQPKTVTVKIGSPVTFLNNDNMEHSVVSNIPGLFKSDVMFPGDNFVWTFSESGRFDYHCGIHSSMVGEIIVE
jgi:plastocyanin